jgi:hypothetical protein
MVDALVSGTSDRKVVWVRLPPSVPPPLAGTPDPLGEGAQAQVAELVYAYV